jgi:type IV pilus assembly protein PilV
MRHFFRQRGFSLIEVMVAVLVFSIGLMGVAGLMVLSVRTNHSAYLRTQASFLAESMAERMRMNLGWIADYNGTYDASTAGAVTCPSPAGCAPLSIVARDRAVWSQQLVDQLPAASANIDCDNLAPEAGFAGIQPYGGLCRMTISWTEADLSRNAGTPAIQTFAWVFQP